MRLCSLASSVLHTSTYDQSSPEAAASKITYLFHNVTGGLHNPDVWEMASAAPSQLTACRTEMTW